LPLVHALSARARLTIAAPGWGPDLYARLGEVVPKGRVPARADVAVLVKPAFRAAWEARHIPRRIGWPRDHRRVLLTDVVAPGAGHRLERIARLGRPLGVSVLGTPTMPVDPVAEPGVVLLPLSTSGATVEWAGYRALADRLEAVGVPVVFGAGPGESARLARVAGHHGMLPELSVRGFAAVVAGAIAVVGNDSGLTHVAAAAIRGAGGQPDRVFGIAGSTDPAVTGAPGATWMTGPRVSCAPCYRKTCRRGLGCLDLAPEAVFERVHARIMQGTSP
jgi:ADP-heptose:LPS heptosyltransferase